MPMYRRIKVSLVVDSHNLVSQSLSKGCRLGDLQLNSSDLGSDLEFLFAKHFSIRSDSSLSDHLVSKNLQS